MTETGNTCANVPPGSSCTLTFTPDNTVVPQTNFTIQGTNTSALTAAIAIESGSTLTGINPNSGTASGGVGVTLTGTGLTDATAVTFDGDPATDVHVVDSTTVTAVTPPHVAGVVDVVIETPAGGATLTNGFTYVATELGQSAFGGTIACLNGGLNNLIAATDDNGIDIPWGGSGIAVGTSAGTIDGESNTTAIVDCLTNGIGAGCPPPGTIDENTYAAGICSIYSVDSLGHSPCELGNTCYDDWFLPAGNNTLPSGQLNCLNTNRDEIGGFEPAQYWSSTEDAGQPEDAAWAYIFSFFETSNFKTAEFRVRCVRAFTPLL
ncbi:hypothetical protein TUM19329_23610 [Legionella antarctica]|uniref:IPT/TIG domain-containing protein n=1 Tax=Legionella antarctica TaxID=2708020 RepID=A0A6F8T778_9GAMM|nr:IPT/TIG domain-containing protein [Legionella antarctica]BCA96000.1 hypothetical protein TUM19329_23610 [Legionella antarctica]